MLDYKLILEKADSGEEIYIYCSKDGRRIPLNSLYSPVKEAERFADKVTTKDKVIFLVGMGNGALVKHWAKNGFNFVHLVIIEPYDDIRPDEELLRIFNQSKNISLYYYKDTSAVLFSTMFGTYAGIEMDLVVHPNYERTNIQYMREIISEIWNGIKSYKINVNTGYFFRKDWILEPLINLKYTYNLTSIEDLKDKFSGERAVLVASGPSLQDNINTLKKLQKSSYIFAAGSAFNGLLNNGLAPDFVAVFDSSERNYEAHFKDSKFTGPLIVSGIVNSKILENHKGDAILVDLMIDNITKRARPELSKFASLPSVALFTFDIICYLGFSEIYLVGQDLALVNDRYYARGVHEHAASRNIKPDIYVDSNEGKKVGTTYSLFSFLRSLESLISLRADSKISVYNLSKQGAKIKGAQFIESESIDFSRKRKGFNIEFRPKVATQESLDCIGGILEEILELFLETEKAKKLINRIVKNSKISIKDTEKAVKALRKLRSHIILEDVITPQLIFQISRINNTVNYSIKEGNGSKERALLIDELNKTVGLIYSLLKEILYDPRYTGLLKELNMIDNEKYKKLYQEGIV
ncbi:MAG: DUF115 domain-containing protein [Peptococcaceae bacterium]|nr:DUF115 domain-containing protein [Peptococcaceae bacterium]